MNPLVSWLEKKYRRQAALALSFSPMLLLAGGLALFFCFWLFYALLFVMFAGVEALLQLFGLSGFQPGHAGRLIAAGLWLMLVCAGYVRRPNANMDPLPRAGYVNWSPTLHGGGSAAGLALMAAYPGATAHWLRDLFQTGPRLIHGAVSLWRMMTAMKNVDPLFCVPYLERLVRAPGAVTWEELKGIHGPDHLPPAVAQLRVIDGVVVLEKGLSLTAALRGDLRPLLLRQENRINKAPDQ